jgi:SNF2 family DNA or RNA helicase
MRTMNHEEPSRPLPIRAAPYQHQQDAFTFACRLFGLLDSNQHSQGTALLMEMGCGKTITAIAITGRLYLDGKICKAFVVAPLSIVGVWEEEFGKFAGFD